MEMQEIAQKLSSFHAMNQGAVKAYEEAESKIQDQNIKAQLDRFKRDHEHHVQEIAQWFQTSGQQQMQPSAEFKNFDQVVLQTFKAAQSQEQIMQCMHVAEAFVNAEYGECLQTILPQEVKQMLQQQLQIEHRHLQAVEEYSPLMTTMGTGTSTGPGMSM